MSGLAEKHKVTIHAGSVAERDGDDYYNTTLVFGPTGSEIAHYRKIHLFDVDAPGGVSYRESNTIIARRGGRDLQGRRHDSRLRHLLRHPLPRTVPQAAR